MEKILSIQIHITKKNLRNEMEQNKWIPRHY